jgi:Domain of unknown function (DUF5615)
VASKTKDRRREDALSRAGWFAVSEDLWRDPGEKPQKPRLLADVNFPADLTEMFTKNGIEIRTAQELNLQRLADEDLLREAQKRGYVLISRDRDFLSDEKFPLHTSGRVIVVEGSDTEFEKGIGSSLLIWLLKSWGGDRGYSKVRANSEAVYLRIIDRMSRKTTYEFKIIKGTLYTRDLRDSNHANEVSRT